MMVTCSGLSTGAAVIVSAGEQLIALQVVLKSQIYAGGRGLGKFASGLQGGVHICKASEVEALAKQMLNQTLVTKQTGPAGMSTLSAQRPRHKIH